MLNKKKTIGSIIGEVCQHLVLIFIAFVVLIPIIEVVFAGFRKNQAIYGFAGADCRATDNVDRMFLPVEHFKLPINYRCGSTILDYTNELFHVGIQPYLDRSGCHSCLPCTRS